jgi:hypothetical protein
MNMTFEVSHDRRHESDEAKAAWFQSLTLEERMDLLCEFTDLILESNPDLLENSDAQSTPGRVRILELP